jgi:hypothetical protein
MYLKLHWGHNVELGWHIRCLLEVRKHNQS